MKHKIDQNFRVISAKNDPYGVDVKELYRYKDLLFSFVKRDISTVYKQTALGPLWFLLSPILTVLIMSLVFGRIVNIPTDGIPKILFYLLGITFWNHFSTNVNSISSTFQSYSGIFTKVYFPRMIAPLAQIVSNTIKFSIQFGVFLCFYFYFLGSGVTLNFNKYILLMPLVLVFITLLAMGIGLIVTSISVKYRDITHFMGFGLNILFYITPIIYPLNLVPAELSWVVEINPLSVFFELLKIGFFGTGEISLKHLFYSVLVTMIVLIIGTVLFNRRQRSFADNI